MRPAERVLHLALREVVGGERPPDVADRILAATTRPRLLRGTHPIRARLPLVAAAAVAAAVALAFLLWPEAPYPRDAATGRAIEVPAERAGPLRVLFADDVELALEPGARATLRRGDATLHEGRATIRGALVIRTPHGDARFEPGATGVADVDRNRLILRVDRGRARIGDDVVEAGERTIPEPLAPERRDELDALLRALAGLDGDPQAQMEAMKSAVDLGSHLAASPASRAYVRERLLAIVDAAPPEARVLLLELLVHDPETRGRTAAAVAADAKPFSLDTILLLFEEGDAVAREELARRVRAAGESLAGVRPAAALALRGDDRGRATLRWFLALPQSERSFDDRFAAAAGLRALGEDAWPDALRFARREIDHQLAADRALQAADIVLRADYFAPRDDIRLSFLSQRMFAFKQPNILELDTAPKIHAYLDEIAAR